MKFNLVVRFAPHNGEAPLGYYRRLASKNALLNWKELALMSAVSASRTGLLGRAEYMATALGLETAWTDALAERETTARSWRGLHRAHHDAVCPECLSYSPHLRDYWEHSYVVVCAEHGSTLIDRCPRCSELFISHRSHLEYCQCGQDLRLLKTGSGTSAQQWIANLLASSGRTSCAVNPTVADVNVLNLSKMVRNLCLLADSQAAGPRRNAASPRTVSEAIEFLAPLESLLSDWPSGFIAHVRQRIANGNSNARTLNTLLGRWYVQLKATAAGGPLDEFVRIVADVASNEYQGVVGLDGVTPTTSAGGFVRVRDAASQIGVGRATLLGAVTRNEVVHRKKKFGARGYLYEVAESEIQRLSSERASWVSETFACSLLGVPAGVLGRIVSSGVVEFDAQWRSDICKAGPASRASLEAFAAKLTTGVNKRQHSGERIALKELSSRRLGDKGAISSAIRAIHNGEVQALGSARTVGGLQYALEEIRSYFATPVLEAGLSVQRLSELTGWKWESISNWIESELLESQSIVLRGQPCRVVAPEQLLRFTRKYVPLADMAKALGTKSSALTLRIGDTPIYGSKSHSDGSQRGGIVCLSDLARLALIGAASKFAQNSGDK